MRTRVRPCEYDCHMSRRWSIEVFCPNEGDGGKWVTNSYHKYLWFANFKASRIATYSLETKENTKNKFIRRLKDGEEDE